ncbi:hypothetical protein SDC9_206383 [bioreactor metagenome]|uniref:Uncharacterized protein n=1 Tax=bioreactor metagenome TaxID=1076179 RepID=A0A645J6C3_9ZZZZ
MKSLFLKVDINAEQFQFSGKNKRVHGISTESGHALRYDGINFTGTAVLNHCHKTRSLLSRGAADALVSIHTDKLT